MPTKKPRVNITISKAHHTLATKVAERDSRTIGLLIEFLLKKYADERGWTDLLTEAGLPAPPSPEPPKTRESAAADKI